MTNPTAYLCEVETDFGTAQYLLIGGNPAECYHRSTNGGKGGANRWAGPVTSPDHLRRLQTTDTFLNSQGRAYRWTSSVLTDNDVAQLQKGFPRVLFQKLSRRESGWITSDDPFDYDVLAMLWDKLLEPTPQESTPQEPTPQAPEPTRRAVSRQVRCAADAAIDGLIAEAEGLLAQWDDFSDDQPEPMPEAPAPPSPAKAEEAKEPEETRQEEPVKHAYINRTVAGDVQDFALLDYALKHGDNVLLYGPTQSGKTSLPLAYAEARNMRAVTISGDAAMDPSELFGHRTLRDGADGYEENHVTEVIRNGGVLVIDEINMFSPKILSPLFSLLDHRREIRIREKGGEVVKAHKDLVVVATMNPRYAGTMAASEALLDRFAHRHEWGYSEAVEEKLVPSESLREMFRNARKQGDIDTPLSTSLMVTFAENVTGLGFDYAKENLANRAMIEEERDALRLLLDTYRKRIEKELCPASEEPEPEKVEAPKKVKDDLPKASTPFGAAPWDV